MEVRPGQASRRGVGLLMLAKRAPTIPRGNLVQVTDSTDNITTQTFNLRGRKTAIPDLDLGSSGPTPTTASMN